MKNLLILLIISALSLSSCSKQRDEMAQPAPCGCGNNGNGGNGNGQNYLPLLGQGVMYAEVTNDPNSKFDIDWNCDGVISDAERATGGFYDISVTDGQGNWYTMYGRLNILNDINGKLNYPPQANPDPSLWKPVLKVTVQQVTLDCGSFWEVKSVQWLGFFPIGMGKTAYAPIAVPDSAASYIDCPVNVQEETSDYQSIFFKYHKDGSVEAVAR